MKLIFSFVCTCLITIAYTQDTERYTLKLDNITNPQEAKQVTDVIRSIINNSEEPFKNYPYFNDDKDVFEFTSSTLLSREAMEEKIITQGYEIIEFKINNKLTPISE